MTPLLWQAAGLLAAVVVGLGGLGFLLSVLLGNRWAALTMLYLILILGMALPFFSYGTLQGHDADAGRAQPGDQHPVPLPLDGPAAARLLAGDPAPAPDQRHL